MSLEPFFVFFLLRYLRKSLKTFSPVPAWDKILSISLYGVIALFATEIIFGTQHITLWIWHIILLFIVWITFKQQEFSHTRAVIYAVLPLIVLSFLSDIIKIFFYKKIENYFGFGYAVAITWMIAMLVRSNKQRKALETERKKTLVEEERSKFIAEQKDQLELLVAERTAELIKQKEELQNAIIELKTTQSQLIQSEKMASLGELTAGIAHEIQNPLNFVNNFSEINKELLIEMKGELLANNKEGAISIANDIIENEQKINNHGKRADGIVKGMLQHSRSSTGQKDPTDINILCDEYLRLSYHGLRAKDKSFNATLKTDFDTSIEKINIDPQDMGRVILNLVTNAFYAVNEKKQLNLSGYEPTVSLTTKKIGNKIEIRIADNGNGIPHKLLDKIFQPFFTTKPTGQGTGLGLSLSYDIITKGHGGELRVETVEGEKTTFIILLPI